MTKEITKAIILQQMQDKFKLRELEPEIFSLSERVIPTYDIGQHLKRRVIEYIEKSITSGPTAYIFYYVPDNERWTIRGYNVVFMGAGAYTVTGVFCYDKIDATKMIYLDMTLGQSVSYAVNLPAPVILEPDSRISIYVDSYTSTQALRLYLDYTVEDIR